MNTRRNTLFIALLLVLLVCNKVMAGNSYPGTNNPDERTRRAVEKTRKGRTVGMTLDQALEVAINCVNKAAGFKKISSRREVPLNRLDDTLEFLGITDVTRLNTLRRYLVRNEEIGVQSVPTELDSNLKVVQRKDEKTDDVLFYRFMITSHDLLTIERSWKLSQLVELIESKAGYSVMPLDTAYKILVDCRVYGMNTVLGRKPSETPTITVNSPIQLNLSVGVDEFSKCVADNPIFGVSGVKFDSAHGDGLRYYLNIISETQINDSSCANCSQNAALIKHFVESGWTFECMAKMIRQGSVVSLPRNALAGELAMTAIKRTLKPSAQNFDKTSKLGDILEPVLGISKLKTQLKFNLDPRMIDLDCVSDKDKGRIASQRRSDPNETKSTRLSGRRTIESITGSDTVEDLVEIIESVLQN